MINICIVRGKICEAILKYMQPTKLYIIVKTIIKHLIMILQVNKLVKNKYQLCIMFHNPGFKNIDIYCVNYWEQVKQQGPSNHLFLEEGKYYTPRPVDNQNQRISR